MHKNAPRLRPASGLLLATIATLSLGIGGVAALWSVLVYVADTLQWNGSDRLQWVMADYPGLQMRASPPAEAVRDWRAHLASFDQIGAFSASEGIALHQSGARRVNVVQATPAALKLAAALPLAGRTLAEGDNADTIIVARAFAEAALGGVASAVGAALVVNGDAVTVVGVFSERLARFLSASSRVDVIRPLNLAMAKGRVTAVGRVRDGVTVRQAQDEIRRLAPPPASGKEPAPSWRLLSRRDVLDSSLARLMSASLLGGGIVLLVMICNIGHLLHARAQTQMNSTAIRTALGATPRRLLGEILSEAIVMTSIGTAAGGLLAQWGLSATTAWLPKELSSLAGIRLAPVAVVVSAAVALVALLSVTLPLAWPRHRVLAALQSDGLGVRVSMFGRWVSNGYLVTLCAASCALAVGASLVSVSVVRLGNVSPGFDANDLYAVELTLPGWKYKDAAQRRLAVTAVADRIEQLASVQGVAIASQAPPAAGMFIGDIAVGDQAVATPILPVAFIGAAYFRTIGQRVLVGREFDAADLANPMVAIISESFARRFAQRPEDLLGTRLQTGKDVREIVGVAADVRSPGVADQLNGLQAYWPLARLQPSTTLLVRSRGLRTSDARAAAAAIDPDLVIETSGVSEMLREARSEVWFLTALFAVLATVAILLAALGIFGVVSAFVARQRTAIAVRLAIGATPSIVRRWLAWRVLSRCAVGVAIGVLASYPFARLFAGQLFEVRANDATTRIIGALVVLAAALPAVAIPAMRAGRISPNQLMRQQ